MRKTLLLTGLLAVGAILGGCPRTDASLPTSDAATVPAQLPRPAETLTLIDRMALAQAFNTLDAGLQPGPGAVTVIDRRTHSPDVVEREYEDRDSSTPAPDNQIGDPRINFDPLDVPTLPDANHDPRDNDSDTDGETDADGRSFDPNDPNLPASTLLFGKYDGDATCVRWQAITDIDPNIGPLPERAAEWSEPIDLSILIDGPTGVWIPYFGSGGGQFLEVNQVGQTFSVTHYYQVTNSFGTISGEVLEAEFDGTTARMVVRVSATYLFPNGDVFVQAEGDVVQTILSAPGQAAVYSNKTEYTARMWARGHALSVGLLEILNCAGTLR